MTALAIHILGERVGWIRWNAVLIGFAGVVLIVKPVADSFTLVALAPLGAAFGYALAGFIARLIDDDVPTPLINLYFSATVLVGALILVASQGGFFPLANPEDIAWIIGMGLFGGSAVLCLTLSFRLTEQSNLAPFTYFGIPLAFILASAGSFSTKRPDPISGPAHSSSPSEFSW
ncbi:MAG: hypothetical protein GDA40_08470 [Rhodobacteraceae bacterium]|nr:hypothetical protein [Paracoccaceae bacterium]